MTPVPTHEEVLAALVDLLDLEQIDLNIYRGQNEKDRPGRLFGGQVAAQSLVAAGRTVEGIPPHSLHGYFLRAGDPATPVIYSVDRIRDGRSFTTRRVVAQQYGKAIFNMAVSFHAAEPSYAHQFDMPDVPDPDSLPAFADHMKKAMSSLPEDFRKWAARKRAVETRYQRPPTFIGGEPHDGPTVVWFKAAAALPDDPFLHQCVLTYATDFSLVDSVIQRHGRNGEHGPLMTASLDHAVWFHRPCKVDDWLLYYQDSPAAFGARGLARGSIYTRDGILVASTAQEALMRPVTQPEDRSK